VLNVAIEQLSVLKESINAGVIVAFPLASNNMVMFFVIAIGLMVSKTVTIELHWLFIPCIL
jgi:hypothetical protein